MFPRGNVGGKKVQASCAVWTLFPWLSDSTVLVVAWVNNRPFAQWRQVACQNTLPNHSSDQALCEQSGALVGRAAKWAQSCITQRVDWPIDLFCASRFQARAEMSGYAAKPPYWSRHLRVSCSSWPEDSESLGRQEALLMQNNDMQRCILSGQVQEGWRNHTHMSSLTVNLLSLSLSLSLSSWHIPEPCQAGLWKQGDDYSSQCLAQFIRKLVSATVQIPVQLYLIDLEVWGTESAIHVHIKCELQSILMDVHRLQYVLTLYGKSGQHFMQWLCPSPMMWSSLCTINCSRHKWHAHALTSRTLAIPATLNDVFFTSAMSFERFEIDNGFGNAQGDRVWYLVMCECSVG